MKISWSKYNLNEMPVYLTKHADDRSKFRDSRPVNISKSRIEKIINKAEDSILNLKDKFKHFVIKTQNSLNIVGELVKEKNDWVFDVITVMVKDKFIPKHSSDKVIFVSESIKLKNLIKENTSLEDIKKILKSSGIPAIKTTQTGLHGSPKYVERKGYYFSNDIVSKSVVIKFREQWPETKNWIKILSKKLKENDIEFFKDKDSIGVYYN